MVLGRVQAPAHLLGNIGQPEGAGLPEQLQDIAGILVRDHPYEFLGLFLAGFQKYDFLQLFHHLTILLAGHGPERGRAGCYRLDFNIAHFSTHS
jgi:hypothetical protein